MNKLYIGFWIGACTTSLAFSYILQEHYTSKHFLRQKNIYLDGKFYQLCEGGKCK